MIELKIIKRTTTLLFIILLSCKSETKTEVQKENTVDASVYEMWSSFTKANPQFKREDLPDSWYFHENKIDANRLGELVATGKKKAGSSLYAWFKDANANLPTIGTKHIITDFDGKALGIIEIKQVDTIPFDQITEAYAELDMGPSIEPLKKWKDAHWDFFEKALSKSGKKPTKDMLIVCEKFETVWAKKRK